MADDTKKTDPSIDFGILNSLVGYRLRRAQMNFFTKFSEVCSDLGISPGLFAIIAIVERNPGLTQTAVAQALGNDRSAMVAAVDKLEKMDILERRPAINDRRSYALFMTKQGKTFFQNLTERVMEHEKVMAARLDSDQELDWLLKTLDTLSQ
ncbi:MarR family transcriptional regulator [Marinomonas sp. M1K-6]|uniref:MarR family transcriptional regulator n=1 Tax=Marinomonas profundi TaxID=2726122 RepID=A0A847R389_9GAMM|nr:MarR family transcriptional regulator [Marinomonas profundi]NLQ18342.1 MarR family transcriptional regulator [Marinomonas profundi]UDV02404.1 MarR family transcriptional regulator [Marinomonas profundi]